MRHASYLRGWLALCCLFGSQVVIAQQFELIVPDSQLRSRAELTGNRLTITDSQGESFTYVRDPELDTPAGDYLGFRDRQTAKALRWPARGEGAFHIGTVAAGRTTFRESQMVIRPLGAPRGRIGNGPSPRSTSIQHVAASNAPNGLSQVAYIDDRGQLQFAVYQRGNWEHLPGRIDRPLLPGAPLALRSDPAAQYAEAYTIDPHGNLILVTGGNTVTELALPRFVPGGQLVLNQAPARSTLYSVAADGRLPVVRLDTQDLDHYVESEAGELIPGSPFALLADERVFIVDRQGVLRGYVRQGRQWLRDDPRDFEGLPIRDFSPGGHLAALRATAPGTNQRSVHLLGVGASRQVELLYETSEPGRWNHVQLPELNLNPGMPIAAGFANGMLNVSATLADGNWYAWSATEATGAWTRHLISRGFRPYAPVYFVPYAGPGCFAIDRHGLLVAARLDAAAAWHATVLAPGPTFARHMVTREVLPNVSLPPAQVFLRNDHTRELWVMVTDLRAPHQPQRLQIPPGESREVTLDRDAGGQLVETFESIGRFTPPRVEQLVYDLPPESLYDVSVYELFLQSVAIDRTRRGQGKIEDANWAPRSIGIFPIPPGGLLSERAEIELHREAKAHNNPGGVRRLNLEDWKIDRPLPADLRVP